MGHGVGEEKARPIETYRTTREPRPPAPERKAYQDSKVEVRHSVSSRSMVSMRLPPITAGVVAMTLVREAISKIVCALIGGAAGSALSRPLAIVRSMPA